MTVRSMYNSDWLYFDCITSHSYVILHASVARETPEPRSRTNEAAGFLGTESLHCLTVLFAAFFLGTPDRNVL